MYLACSVRLDCCGGVARTNVCRAYHASLGLLSCVKLVASSLHGSQRVSTTYVTSNSTEPSLNGNG